MKIIIIEDEVFAAKRLENMIKEFDSGHKILAKLESVNESVAWFKSNPQPDLIFLDIHLEDNLSFAMFNEISVNCPIIFTTATDELAIKAFILKGIDYLHKPIVQDELNRMLQKYANPDTHVLKVIDAGYFSDLMNSK
ncbi:MAG: response regulator [Bacteroidales bacterium]|nr:response regulator [Bacteroidales bacterium]